VWSGHIRYASIHLTEKVLPLPGCRMEESTTIAWLVTETDCQKTVTHPGTNRARRALTSFMRRTPLTTAPRSNVCKVRWNFKYPFNCKFTRESSSQNFFNRLRFDGITVMSLWPRCLVHPVRLSPCCSAGRRDASSAGLLRSTDASSSFPERRLSVRVTRRRRAQVVTPRR